MLIYASWKDAVRHYAGPTKGDAISGNVQEDIAGLNLCSTQFARLVVGNVCQASAREVMVQYVLATDQDVLLSRRQVVF